ncbi:metal ABC transporter substrate-binding protein [Aquisalimonas asiatica]|uniref:Zinc/manganese transport system substrate-binding protein n=1 Tax=Aquisalimonas asiatica TaxID=406100 RepID=A0A1H8S1P8_9GAMM|nr:metal ABC transporter substrate-binding protein [Aquisalimonas asiatica]SEO72103.1 zinc/manganese transport system substrate-binding protein [Aquisalimonas asiatica]
MLKRALISSALGAALAAAPAAAEALSIAATTSNMGMLAKHVGGDHVEVTTMAPPDRDAHYLEARPSMMSAIRRADLVVSVGAELEEGWLPAAIRGANNPGVRAGTSGYFEAAAQVDLLGTGGEADRSRGDVHPAGNPHVYLDPIRMGEIAKTLAARMAEMDSANADTYHANAEAFAERADEYVDEWRERVDGAPGVVLYHDDATYLLDRLDVADLGFLEPVPGNPPTGSHLRALVSELEGKDGVIIRYPYQREDHVNFVAEQLGWQAYELMPGVQVDGTADDYFELIGDWVEVIASPIE